MGEKDFYTACNILRLDADSLGISGRSDLKDITNFDIVMSIITEKTKRGSQIRQLVMTLFYILFPKYNITLSSTAILLKEVTSDADEIEGEEKKKDEITINKNNFNDLVNIVSVMCCLQKASEAYNPSGSLAAKLAAKMKRGRQQAAAAKGRAADEQGSALEREVSIISTGLQIPIGAILNYTIYQLSDIFTRFQLKMNYDTYLSAKMAGATGMKEAENWMKNIHDD